MVLAFEAVQFFFLLLVIARIECHKHMIINIPGVPRPLQFSQTGYMTRQTPAARKISPLILLTTHFMHIS